MLILILIICIALAVSGCMIMNKYKSDALMLAGASIIMTGVLAGMISLVSIMWMFSQVIDLSVIDDKVVMYQKENKTIETQIDEIVKNYMKYENNTFKEFKTESSVAIVSLYPELKSDTLVKSQIETYTKNNNKIKGLKEKKIMRSVYRWWLYFGK